MSEATLTCAGFASEEESLRETLISKGNGSFCSRGAVNLPNWP